MKMSTSDQVFNFLPQLDAIICSVSMIPVNSQYMVESLLAGSVFI